MRVAGRTLTILGWVVVLLLAAVAALRVVAWDHTDPLILLDTITVWLYLPAWCVALGAVLGRRQLLAICALAVASAQIAFLAPELTAGHPLPRWARSAPTIRVFDANVYDENRSMAGYVRPIEDDHPDLVTLEEASPRDAGQLERAGAFSHLPYRFEIDRHDPWAFVVASRYPLRETHVVSTFSRPLVVETHIVLPSGTFTLWVVHTVAPLPGSWQEWAYQLDMISTLLRTDRPRALLLVGDFNATWNNKAFRAILGDGLTDGAAARGDPFEMTWSQMMPPLPPFVRIDHVLTGAGVAVVRIGTGDGPGSDHRYIEATVAVRR